MMRRLRGIITTAIAWSFVFVLAQLPIAATLYALVPAEYRRELWPIILGVSAIFAGAGFFSGAAFATIIVRRARNRTLEQLSIRRFAWWGAAAGAITPALVTPLFAALHLMPGGVTTILALSGVGIMLGCGMASSTLWIARRAEARAELASGQQQRAIS